MGFRNILPYILHFLLCSVKLLTTFLHIFKVYYVLNYKLNNNNYYKTTYGSNDIYIM